MKNIIRTLFYAVFSLVLVSCGGQTKTPHSPDQHCSPPTAFTGERLDFQSDLSSLASQPSIDIAQPLPNDVVTKLENTLTSIISETNAGDLTVTLAIPGKGTWTTTRIVTEPQASQVKSNEALFWWMSIGKAYTAVVIHQLVTEGKLNLDDTIDRWFPKISNANLITIDHLLTHTSGLYSFQEDPAFREKTVYRTANELIDIALSHNASFCPGTNWYYSNTGYVLLGLLIEKIESKNYAQVINDRITAPLGLGNTRALIPREFPSNLILTADRPEDDAARIPSVPFSAGNIVSTSQDMVVFLQALLTGKLYDATLLHAAINRPYRMFESELSYGKGIMTYRLDRSDITLNWLGHSGGITTKNALIAYDFASGAYIALSLNDKTSAPAIAVKLFAAAKAINED